MKDDRIREQVHQAVDQHAERLRPDPLLAQRIIAQERTGAPAMKKRVSAALVFAVILVLITVTALAAVLLGGRDFVEQIMAPRASETGSDSFTKEEISEILRIAAENQLTLSDEDMYVLTHLEETGYFKEELMRRFVKAEYGPYPDAWPIEVQHWYEQMLEACGLDDGVITNVLPEGDEITEAQALRIAQEHIHQKYGPDADLDDPDKYRRFLTYRESRLGQDMKAREWSLAYEARDLYGRDYHLTLDPAGHITNEYSVDGILGASFEARGQFMMDRFVRVYGDPYGFVSWDSAMLIKYQQAMLHRQTLPGPEHFQAEEYPILDMTYVLPDDTMLSRDAAIAKAKDACGDLDYETLYGNSAVAVCMANPEGLPVWKVTLRLRSGGYVYAQLDAKTGDILFIDTGMADTYRAWRQYVTEEYWQAEKPGQKASSPAAQAVPEWRLPAFWGDTDVAPEWYWDRLDAVGMTGAEAEDALYQSWMSQYGSDPDFWPLEAQAIERLTRLGDDPDFGIIDFPGLPTEEDIPREEALRIARAAFKEEYAAELPGLDVSTLKGAFSFWFDYMFESHNAWQVNLYRPDGVKIGAVWLESRLGEVFQLECFDGAPGLRVREVSFMEPIATPAPLADGRPWMWGMDFAPPAFWDRLQKAMDDYGVTPNNLEQKEREWAFQYGDIMFAPYECQVIASVLSPANADLFLEEKPYYHTFPTEGKITREQAMEIAVQALHEAGDEETGADFIDDLKISAVLSVNGTMDGLYLREEPTWSVFFFAWDDTYGCFSQKGSVYLTEDGEVILAQMELGGNG